MKNSAEVWGKCLNVSQMSIIHNVSFCKDFHMDMSKISLSNDGSYISYIGIEKRANCIGNNAAAYSISTIGLEGPIASVSSIGNL